MQIEVHETFTLCAWYVSYEGQITTRRKKLVLSYRLSLRDWAHVVRLDSKHLYLLSHFPGLDTNLKKRQMKQYGYTTRAHVARQILTWQEKEACQKNFKERILRY